MALFDELPKSWLSSALVGIGAALVAPAVLPALGSGIRPLAKSVLRGGILAYDKARELVAEAGEDMSDLIAEVRSEMDAEHHAMEGGQGQRESPIITPADAHQEANKTST